MILFPWHSEVARQRHKIDSGIPEWTREILHEFESHRLQRRPRTFILSVFYLYFWKFILAAKRLRWGFVKFIFFYSSANITKRSVGEWTREKKISTDWIALIFIQRKLKTNDGGRQTKNEREQLTVSQGTEKRKKIIQNWIFILAYSSAFSIWIPISFSSSLYAKTARTFSQ